MVYKTFYSFLLRFLLLFFIKQKLKTFKGEKKKKEVLRKPRRNFKVPTTVNPTKFEMKDLLSLLN